MSDRKLQLIGLAGFMISGVLFFLVGWRSNDYLTVASSIVWIAACGVFGYPLLRPED